MAVPRPEAVFCANSEPQPNAKYSCAASVATIMVPGTVNEFEEKSSVTIMYGKDFTVLFPFANWL